MEWFALLVYLFFGLQCKYGLFYLFGAIDTSNIRHVRVDICIKMETIIMSLCSLTIILGQISLT